jgi:hypothetical protein
MIISKSRIAAMSGIKKNIQYKQYKPVLSLCCQKELGACALSEA